MRRWGLAAGSRSLGLYFTLLFPGYHEVRSACHIHAPAEPAETSEAKGASLLRSVCHIAHSRVKRAALNIRTFSQSPLAYPPLLLSSDEEWFRVLRVSVGAADALGPCQMEEGLRTEPGRAGLSQLSGGWWWDSEKAWLWEQHAHDAWWINQPWPLLGRADSQRNFPKPGIWKSGISVSCKANLSLPAFSFVLGSAGMKPKVNARPVLCYGAVPTASGGTFFLLRE